MAPGAKPDLSEAFASAFRSVSRSTMRVALRRLRVRTRCFFVERLIAAPSSRSVFLSVHWPYRTIEIAATDLLTRTTALPARRSAASISLALGRGNRRSIASTAIA
jgi:hypothetical protein